MIPFSQGRPRDTAYGIDFSGSQRVIVRARRGRRGPVAETVLAVGAAETGTGHNDAMTSLQSHAAAGAGVAAAMPADQAFLRWIQTPFSSTGKAERVLPSVLDIQLPFPLESCVYVFPRLVRDEAGTVRALALAAREEDVEARLKELAGEGIHPTRLEHEAAALWEGAADDRRRKQFRYYVVAYVRQDRWTLAVGTADRLQSSHTLRLDAARPVADQAATLSARIDRVLRAQCSETDAGTRWLWTGPAAEERVAVGSIEDSLRADRRIEFCTTDEPASFLARALATGALLDKGQDRNLRRERLEHPDVAAARSRRTRRASLTALAAGILLILTNVGWRHLLEVRNHEAQEAVTREAASISGLPAAAIPPGQELLVVRRHLAESGATGGPIAQAFAPGASDALRRSVAAAQRRQVSIHDFTVRENQFFCRGTAPNAAALKGFETDLQADGLDPRAEEVPGAGETAVGFRVRGVVRLAR